MGLAVLLTSGVGGWSFFFWPIGKPCRPITEWCGYSKDSAPGQKLYPAATEEEILAIVLRRNYHAGQVLLKDASLWQDHVDGVTREDIRFQLQGSGLDITGLVDRFFERNQTPVRLSLQPAPADHYVIDYTGTETAFTAYEITSLPVYDRKTGLVLVYIGGQRFHFCGDWEGTVGHVILYRYDGELHELKRVSIQHVNGNYTAK